MGNPPDSERSASENSTGPGHRLGKAREAGQLTIDAVAAQLRVEAKVIAALEHDDYARLPSAVFVRGYLRGYARLVGLPAEPLIEAFDRRTTQAPPPLVLPTAIGPDIEPRRSYARWLILALVLLALAVFYQWWRSGEHAAPPPQKQTTSSPAAAPPASTPASISPSTSASTPVPTPAATQIIAEPSSSVPAMPLENLYDTPPDESAASALAAAAPRPETTPRTASVTRTSVLPSPASPVTGSAELVLRFNADSWVVVRDAAGRALLQGVAKAGSRRALQGKPPFQVTLGNSPAVEVEYRGQRFDQSRYNAPTRVARFTVGSQ